MADEQPKKIPQFHRTSCYPTDADELVPIVNTITRVLNDHVDGMLVLAKTMFRLTDMVEKHNKFLIELRKMMSFEGESNNESILPPH